MSEVKKCALCNEHEVEGLWTICPSCLEWNLFETCRMLSELENELGKSIKKLRAALSDVVEK
jgi:hypothetical protein